MATVIVNGQEIEVGDDERLNGIQVAARAGYEIPHYCWHAGLSVVASCRMCLVESGMRKDDGEISMMPKLVPACQTPAKDGSVFVTESEKVINARAMVEEDLLIRHPIDCPICDKAGECSLQDYHFQHGREERRADIKPFNSRRRPLGDTVTLFVDRCVMCTRCVRFCREISGDAELMVINRGADEEIDVFPGFPLDNRLAGNVVDLCPVGALGDKDFLYQQRVWFMKKHEQVCAGCSTGCSIYAEENQDRLYRVKPRENPHINQWWMCDEGRYGWKHVHDEHRLAGPRRRSGRRDNAEYELADWTQLPKQLDSSLRKAERLAAVISPHLTVEEAYLLSRYIRSIDPQALLCVGPAPVQGEDETFANGFTIRAEKCPNRRGVKQVVGALAGDQAVAWEDLPQRCQDDSVRGVWITGGYKNDWNDQEVADRFAGLNLDLLIVQDLFETPLLNVADIQLPAASFAEREGSYVNHADRLQSFQWAIRPPAGVNTEGRLFWRLSGREGMYDSQAVLREIAAEIGYFEAATDDIPDVGVDLKVHQIA